jgi:hypothetical protein
MTGKTNKSEIWDSHSNKKRAIFWWQGSNHFWTVTKHLPDYTVQQPRRQPSSKQTKVKKNARIRIYNKVALPNLLYGNKTWTEKIKDKPT